MTKAEKVKISAEDAEWRVESDLRTLMDAERIRRDPKRLAKAQTLAKERMLEAASVASKEPKDD